MSNVECLFAYSFGNGKGAPQRLGNSLAASRSIKIQETAGIKKDDRFSGHSQIRSGRCSDYWLGEVYLQHSSLTACG
jgi:hypothetical protein